MDTTARLMRAEIAERMGIENVDDAVHKIAESKAKIARLDETIDLIKRTERVPGLCGRQIAALHSFRATFNWVIETLDAYIRDQPSGGVDSEEKPHGEPTGPAESIKKQLKNVGYFALRQDPATGAIHGLSMFIYTVGLCCNLTPTGYSHRYCYPSLSEAAGAFDDWERNGFAGEPAGYIKRKGDAGV